MANTVETFRDISLLIFKWLLFALLGIVALGLAVWGVLYAYQYLTYDRYAAKVEITVGVSRDPKHICADSPNYPLFIGIINNSSKALDKVSFSLKATRKGHSTNLADYETYTDDKIRKPGEGWGNCWRAPLKANVKDDPRDLEWSVDYARMTFE
jgi:hypothetical protein